LIDPIKAQPALDTETLTISTGNWAGLAFLEPLRGS